MMNLNESRFHWLAGLLEGEASFILTRPNQRNGPQPIIRLVMSDVDVVQQVADIFGVGLIEISPRQSNWSTTWLTQSKGASAYFLMEMLQPLMGTRRREQIQSVLAGYRYVPNHVGSNNESAKLDELQVRQIKRRLARGETAKSIAKDYSVTHYAIWAIRSGKTWSHVSVDDVCLAPVDVHPIQIVPDTAPTDKALYWLAGLLEGEGSFLPGPPSAPNRPGIQVSMTDEDVIARVADLFGVKYHRWQRTNPNHKPSFQVLLRGKRAADYMSRLHPLMGQRRQGQIDRALASFKMPDQRGEKNNQSKLTAQQVIEIKNRLQKGERPSVIAANYEVSHYTIMDIKLGRTWQQLDE